MMRRLPLVAILAALVTTTGAAQRIRLPAGLAELEQRALKDSNDAAAHYNVSLAYFNAKRYDDAERALRTAVTIDPKLAPAWLALSRLPFLRRPKIWDEIYERGVPEEWVPRLHEAESHYRRAFLIDPLVDLRIEAIARPGRSAFWVSSPAAEALYRYFFQEAANGRLNALYDNMPTVRERDGLPNFIFYYRGLAAAHIGRFREAQTDFALLLQRAENHLNPDSLVYYLPLELNEYRYMLAVLNQRGGDPNEAISGAAPKSRCNGQSPRAPGMPAPLTTWASSSNSPSRPRRAPPSTASWLSPRAALNEQIAEAKARLESLR